MKKAIALLIFPVFLFGIIGWQCLFFVALSAHEEVEWHDGGDLSGLERIIISRSHPGSSFFINANELMHQGKLFDIKHKEKRGDTLVCYGKHDKLEEKLLITFASKAGGITNNALSSKSRSHSPVQLSIYLKAGLQFILNPNSPQRKVQHVPGVADLRAGEGHAFFIPPEIA